MNDRIIYCSDLIALKNQLKKDGFYDVNSKTYTVNHTITPLQYKGNESLSYVRDFNLDLNVYTMLEDLGNYNTIVQVGNEAKLAKYQSVYDYLTPVTYTDLEGNKQTYNKPFEIGNFL